MKSAVASALSNMTGSMSMRVFSFPAVPPPASVSQEAVEHYVAPLFFAILLTLLETTAAGARAIVDNEYVVYY